MSNYKYNGNDIYYIIQRTGTSSSPYNGFPTSSPAIYTSGIDLPQPFQYQVTNVDLSNQNSALTHVYSNSGTFLVDYSIPNSNPIAYFKHISGYCIGGSGGGGGGGGAYTGPAPKHGGGNGAIGNPGGYAAIVQCLTPAGSGDTLYKSIYVTVGTGGGPGSAGGKSPNGSAGDGKAGFPGNDSLLKVGFDPYVLSASGGLGGDGGNGGNKASDGKDATPYINPNPASSAIGGKSRTTNANSPPPPWWPPNNSVGGNNGNGGGTNNSANGGGPGSTGYAQVWFSYSAT